MDKISKNYDYNIIKKEIIKYRSIQIKNTDIDNIIIIPYDEYYGYNNITINKLLITSDVIAKQKTQLGIKTFIIPIINISYNTKEIYTSKQGEAILYKKYKNFYHHCKNIGIQFIISYKKFFNLLFHQEILKKINHLQKKNFLHNTYSVRPRSIESQSVLTKEEIEYKQEEIEILYIKFFIESKKHVIISHIKDPIYLFGINAILVHPKDKKYKKFIGKNVILPIINKAIPVIGDDTVNNSKYSGTIALIPGHNEKHLELAKKHNLPTNIFSINELGEFTDIAQQFKNKNAYDFKGNIIRFLDDIGNLQKIETILDHIPYEKYNGNKVLLKASEQREFYIPENSVYPDIKYEIYPKKREDEINDYLYKHQKWCISKQLNNLYKLPLFKDNKKNILYLDINKIISNFKNKKTQNILFTIFMIIGYLHGYWNETTISNILFIITKKYSKKDKLNLGERIIEFINYKFGDKRYENEIKELTSYIINQDIKESQNIDKLLKYIENNYGIKYYNNDIIGIDWSEIFTLQEGYNIKINKTNLYTIDHKLLSIIQTSNFIKNLGFNNNFTIIYNNYSKDIIHLFHQYQCSYNEEKNINIYNIETSFLDNNINKFKEVYDGDSIRLFCILGKTYSIEEIEKYSFYIKKIWNGSRYIILNYKGEGEKNEYDIHDKWILNKFNNLIEQYKKNKYINTQFIRTILETICYDFFDNYMTISKTNINNTKKQILNEILKYSIQLLFPIIPFISQKIWNLQYKNEDINNIKNINKIYENEIDYNFVLYMNIIKKYKKRYYKYHGLNILQFYIKGNSDIIKYMKDKINILNTIIKRNEIKYIDLNNNIPIDCLSKDNIVDIELGIKTKTIKEKDKVSTKEIETHINEKKQKLQKIREIISLIQEEEIAMKKTYISKLDKLKKEIEELEIKYTQIKFFNKNK